MRIFNAYVVQTGEELCVAARTSDHAAEVLITFWIARTGSAPGEFHIGREKPSTYKTNSAVRNIAAGDAAGVLVRQPDGSMLFESAIS